MILIVGLGNPGKQYEKTYHNIGFLTLDALAKALGGEFTKSYGDASVCEVFYAGTKIILAKPQTYMNLSGRSVLNIKNKFKIENENILVVLDDIDLPVGKTRFRKEGSAGTHNGLRDITQCLGTTTFNRMRIGIGRDERMPLDAYVLSKISDENMPLIQKAILESVDYIIDNFLNERESK
ncbi:MAG: aminoacyl-tRNA hydrolase [Christensenellales bacterium]|jgi:PTH1 family peptidyl-tRNA hydrolase